MLLDMKRLYYYYSNVLVVIIITIVFSTITFARKPINTNFHNCDINMNKYFGDWHNSFLSCVQHAITDLNWASFTGNREEVDVMNYFKKFSGLVSTNYIRNPSQYCQELYDDDDDYRETCESVLEDDFGKDSSNEEIFITALFTHRHLIPLDAIIEKDYVNIHPSDQFIYEYLDDIASLITSSAGMNKHFKDWNHSVFNTVHHAITDMLLEDFDDDDYTRNLFQELSNSVSADHIRYPIEFCQKYEDNEEKEACVSDLNGLFEIEQGNTKHGILNIAILYHRQVPDVEEGEVEENSEIDNEYGKTIHVSDTITVAYLYDIASRITSLAGGKDSLMFQSPLHYCSYLHNKPLYFQLITT